MDGITINLKAKTRKALYLIAAFGNAVLQPLVIAEAVPALVGAVWGSVSALLFLLAASKTRARSDQ